MPTVKAGTRPVFQILTQKIQEIGLLLSVRLVVAALSPLLGLYIVRYLRVDDYGIYAVASGIVGLFSALPTLGLSLMVARYAARQPDQMIAIRNQTLILAMGYALVGYSSVAGWVLAANYSALVVQLTLILAGQYFLAGVSVVLLAQAQVLTRYRLMAMTALSASTFQSILTVGLLLTRADIRILFGVPLLAGQLIQIVGLVQVRLFAPKTAYPQPHSLTIVPHFRQFIKDSWIFGLGDILYRLYFQSDIVILSLFLPVREVGLYTLPFMILNLIYLVPTTLFSDVLYPKFFQWSKESSLKFGRYYLLSSKLMLVFGLGSAVVLFVSADLLITTLFGPEFMAASIYLKILAWAIPLRCWVNGVAAALAAADKMGSKNRRQFVAVLINIIANFIWVPYFGALASAWITVATELVLLVLYVPLLHRHVFDLRMLGQLRLIRLSLAPLAILTGWALGIPMTWLPIAILGLVGLWLAQTDFFCAGEWHALLNLDTLQFREAQR